MEKEHLRKYRKAGEILAEVLEHGRKMIKPGVSFLEICEAAEKRILDAGAGIAFPAQIARNATAAHYCPVDDLEKCEDGDIIKLDCGVHVDGCIADSAVTVSLGDHDELVKASQDALKAALKVIGVGVKVSEVGKEIQEAIESYGFAPVRNLSGHGLGIYEVHTNPSIPNYDSGSQIELQKGMVVAVEPFASEGAGVIYESSNPTVFSLKSEKPVRSMMARKLMRDIKSFHGLPFTSRWLMKKHSEGMVKLGLRELARQEIIEEYPPLIDKAEGNISQAEHTVIIQDKPVITTKL